MSATAVRVSDPKASESDVPRGYKWTEAGTIPCDWDVVSLGDAASVSAGGTPSRSVATYWNGRVPWITTTEVDFGTIMEAQQFITEEGLRNSAAKLLPPGTILIALYGQGKTRGKVAVLGIEAATNQACAAIAVRPAHFGNFVFQQLASRYEEIRKLSNTGNQDNLNSSLVRSIKLLLPKRDEQRKIAATLSDVDALIGALDKLIAKKRAMKLAAMQQLLTGKTRLPGFTGGWRDAVLGQLGRFSKGRGIKRDDVTDEGVLCIRYGEIYTRYENYVFDVASRIPASVAANALPIQRGDLLFAGSGETAEEIGKCVAYMGHGQAYAGGDIVVLSPTSGDSLYLGHLLNQQAVVEQKAQLGQGDAVVHISAAHLGRVRLRLPDVDEQLAIARVLLDMDSAIAALERRRDKTKDIKQGMMQELLTGRTRLV